jgi:hypothetical protein
MPLIVESVNNVLLRMLFVCCVVFLLIDLIHIPSGIIAMGSSSHISRHVFVFHVLRSTHFSR